MIARKSVLVAVVSIVAVVAIGAVWFLGANRWQNREADALGRNEIAANGTVQGILYPGNPASEARIVETENTRLVHVRTVASAARWRIDGLNGAYRLNTGAVNISETPPACGQ